MFSLAMKCCPKSFKTYRYDKGVWTSAVDEAFNPKLEFYNRFMNVLKCFAEQV